MKRVVRGVSLLIVSAIVSACAGQREVDKAQDTTPGPAAEQRDDAAIPETPATKGATVSQHYERNRSEAIAAAPNSALIASSSRICCPPIYQQPANTERYQHLDDNPVHLAAEHPVSTFSIDVDTGAYANVRRFLNAGQLRKRSGQPAAIQ